MLKVEVPVLDLAIRYLRVPRFTSFPVHLFVTDLDGRDKEFLAVSTTPFIVLSTGRSVARHLPRT
jgi:hypothetical protein